MLFKQSGLNISRSVGGHLSGIYW